MINLEKLKTVSEIIGVFVTAFGILIGGLFAGYQYLDNKQAEKVKASLFFLDRYNQESLQKHVQNLNKAWNPKEAELYAKASSNEALDQFVMDVVKKSELEPDIFQLIDFYKSLQTCIRANICDYQTAASFFKSEARSFYHLHYPFINSVRTTRQDPDFGSELYQFITTPNPP